MHFDFMSLYILEIVIGCIKKINLLVFYIHSSLVNY